MVSSRRSGRKGSLVGVADDITESRQAKERIAQLNRVKEILVGVDRAIVRISNKQELMDEICRIAVEKGGSKLAWIGMVSPEGSVLPVAKAGAIAYLDGIRVVTHEHEPEGCGPVGTAIRENRPVVIVDIANDEHTIPWRQRAKQQRLHYAAVFPLRLAGKAIGSFQVYADRASFFDENELSLLAQVSDDISFALTAIDDNAKRKRAEEELHASERNLRTFSYVVEQSPASVYIANPSFEIVYVNQKFTEVTGYSREEVLGKHPRFMRSEQNPPNLYEEIGKTIGDGGIWRGELCSRKKNGELYWESALIAPIKDKQGTITHFVALKEDITERRQAGMALRESEEKYRTLFMNMAEEVHFWELIRDDAGQIKTWRLVDANPPTLKSWRKSLDEIKGKTSDELFPGSTNQFMAVIQKIMTGGVSHSFENYSPELDKYFQFTCVPFGNYFISTGVDVTSLKKEQEALRESEERFRQVTDTIDQVFWMSDVTKSKMIYISPGYERIWGRTCQSLYDSPRTWLDAIHPDDRQRVLDAAITKQSIGQYNVEYRIIRPDGTERVIHDRSFPIKDPAGKVYRIVGVADDITERRRLEHQVLEIGTREQRRIGQELHDDICQWLSGTAMLAGVLAKDLTKDSPANAPKAQEIADYTQHTLHSLRLLARGLTPAVIESEGLVAALSGLALHVEKIFHVRCSCDCARTIVVRNQIAALQLYRIAQEAITNAVKHGGAREVRITFRVHDNFVTMAVCDNGRGMPKSMLQTMGMGLQTMRYRAESIGGTLEIRPGPDGGTEVACTLSKELCKPETAKG